MTLTSRFQLRSVELEAKRALSTIWFSMNTSPTINRLPPEVLALIPSFLISYKDLVYTTHVCRYWRDTIIASPLLWSTLDNEKMCRGLVAACMDRCGDAPLDVFFSSELHKNIPFLKKVVLRSSRIRKMHIPYSYTYQIGQISDAFDAPLPLLREVEFDISHRSSPPQFRRPFLAGATNLVSLHVHVHTWPPDTLLHFNFPTLTKLTLFIHYSGTTTISELLELFRTSPLIEALRIHAYADVLDAPEENSAFPYEFQPVDLPCLYNIDLGWSTIRSLYTLITHIQYPSNCSVSMQVRSESDIAQPPLDVFPKSWDAFSLPDLSCVTLRMKREEYVTECAVVVKKPNGASVSVSHYQTLHEYVSRNWNGHLVRDPNRDRDDNRVFSDAIEFVGMLPLRLIRKFELKDLRADEMSKPELFEIPPALINMIRSDMTNLTTLSLTRTCVSELFNILTPPPPPDLAGSDAAPGTIMLPCPALKVLKIRGPYWVTPQHCHELLALAKARKREGIPFERVVFSPLWSGVPVGLTNVYPYVKHFEIQRRYWGGE